jgi:DNA end-binding protein Ku
MARAMWKAVLSFGGVELPVKLYAAVEERKVHFNLLSPSTGERVRQRMVDPDSGEEVPGGEVRKGLELEPGRFVVLEDEELEELRPEPSRTIEVTRFVDRSEIDHRWYERPYYVGPDDGAAVEDDYFALAAALAKRGEEGVARWVMRNKAYAGSLHERDGYLMLVTLRSADEVIPASELEPPGGPALEKREREMAEQLVAAYEDEFEPGEFRDEYRHKLEQLIDAKAEGAPIKLRKLRPKKPPKSLAGALEKSLAEARKQPRRDAGGKGGG